MKKIINLYKYHSIPGVFCYDKNNKKFFGKHSDIPTYEDLKIYSYLLNPKIGYNKSYSEQNKNGLYQNTLKKRIKVFRFMAQAFCPQQCSFCSTRNFLKYACQKKPLKYISLKGLERLAIIENIIKTIPEIETIFINDDDLFTLREEVIIFFKEIISAKEKKSIKRDLSFIISARIDEFDDELLSYAKQANVILINIGVESFHRKGLLSLNKKVRFPEGQENAFIKKTIKLILKEGITPSINLIMFYPETNFEELLITVQDTIELLELEMEVNITTYIRVYHGADILNDKSIPISSFIEPIIDLISPENSSYFIKHDSFLLPKNLEIREFAENVIIRRSILEEELKRKYCWSHRRAPQKVVQIVFLKAILEQFTKTDYLSHKQVSDLFLRIDLLIYNEFRHQVYPLRREEPFSDYPLLSLSLKHQEETIKLIKTLQRMKLDCSIIRIMYLLKTNLFCQLWNYQEFSSIKDYLYYLFTAEQKSRFFHLDEFDKFIIVVSVLDQIESLESEQRKEIFNAFEIKQKKEFFYKIKILLKNDIWFGPDKQKNISNKIHLTLLNIFNSKNLIF